MYALYFYHLLKGKSDQIPAIKGSTRTRVVKPFNPESSFKAIFREASHKQNRHLDSGLYVMTT